MSEGFQDESTNQDAHEETPFILTPVQAISRVIGNQNKAC